MSDREFQKRAIESHFRRNVAETPEFDRANQEANDWRGVCTVCGEEVTGTLKELRDHRCGAPQG